MEPTQTNLSLEDSVRQIIQQLPLSIRRYIANETYRGVLQSLAAKYGLHSDQSAILEREVLLLLLGVEAPDEFITSLITDAAVDQPVAIAIAQAVNAEIFVPLRDMMNNIVPQQSPSAEVPNYSQSATPNPARPAPVREWKNVMPEPSVMIQANPRLPQRASEIAESLMKRTAPPPRPPVSLRPTPSATPVTNAIPAPAPAQPAFNPARALADHEEPQIQMTPQPRPSYNTPPANLPGAMPPAPKPFVPPQPPPAAPPRPPITSYSTDPYREPVDAGDLT